MLGVRIVLSRAGHSIPDKIPQLLISRRLEVHYSQLELGDEERHHRSCLVSKPHSPLRQPLASYYRINIKIVKLRTGSAEYATGRRNMEKAYKIW